MVFEITKTCCFTGHRFKNFDFSDKEDNQKRFNIKRCLREEINKAIKLNFKHFISGGAIGVDTWSIEIILKIKKDNPFITYEIVVPCVGQSDSWSNKNKKEYEKITFNADKLTFLSNRKYFSGCMQIRNKYMVDNSNLIIAVYDGFSLGGTKNTISYAKKCKKNLIIIGNW
ncbi:MAG: DUF1273 domain-containing protein [Clostridiales bacterium]|jgi:uncharacterized phage-like protein YoqJ|nr:DUF1273 domain-containing protein [Clostridiales bacterium]